jgi:hypothetical protein
MKTETIYSYKDLIVKRLLFGKDLNYARVDSLLDETMKMLNRMLSTLRS